MSSRRRTVIAGRGNTPTILNQTGTPVNNSEKQNTSMTLREKLALLKDLQANKQKMSSLQVHKTLLQLTLADDAPDSNPVKLSRPENVVFKRINFDEDTAQGASSTSSTKEELEGRSELEYIKVISSTLDCTEKGKKLCEDVHDGLLASQFNEHVKLGMLVDMLDKLVVPALEKMIKDPLRIHDLIRQAPMENAIPCKVEDQEEFVENFRKLSQQCNQLRRHFHDQSSQFDLEARLTLLEAMTERLDSTLSIVAAEKIRFGKFQSLQVELESERFNSIY